MNNLIKIAEEIIDFLDMKKAIQKDLISLYRRLGIEKQFSPEGFRISKENSKMKIEIPYMSTIKNSLFSEKLLEGSKDIVLRHLKKKGYNKKKSDMKFEGKAEDYYSLYIFIIEI